MAIDIRATVTCSLGTLISASLSDDYLQGTGLVKCKGSCEISGVITPAIGTVVTFSYTKDGVTRSVPRKLRVLSSFADPFRRTTKVELGCKLTYLADLKEPVNWKAFDDPENASYTEADAEVITLPIHASSVMNQCLSQLGLSASSNPLTNKFSIAKFDFSPGYVQVLSDLLVSESYCGYLDESEVLQVFSLSAEGGTGPAIDSSKIIDLGPIGVGQLPGEAVTVSYNTLKLKAPDVSNDFTPWTYNITSSTQSVAIAYTNLEGDTYFKEYDCFQQTQETIYYQEIDGNSVPQLRAYQETKSSPLILGNVISNYLSNDIGFGNYSITTYTEERFTYDKDGNETFRVLDRFGNCAEIVGGLGIPFAFSDEDYVTFPNTNIPLERTEVYTYVNGNYRQYTTIRYGPWTETIGGQQAMAESGKTFTTSAQVAGFLSLLLGSISNIDAKLKQLYLIDVTTQSEETSRKSQRGPSTADQINQANAATSGNPNNGYRTEAKAELELALGSATAQRRIEFSLPYAPDDIFYKDGASYKSTPSDAEAKANLYGRVQNKLLMGNRNGANYQLAPEVLPTAPFAPFVVQANGLSALYRNNGTSWTMDANGVVVSTDALFWGAVGGTGTFWFPVAPGITTLPTTPAVVDGQMTVASVVPVWQETVLAAATTRIGLQAQSLPYALSALTEVPAIRTKVSLQAQRITKVAVPAKSIAIAALTPAVGTSVQFVAPATNMIVSALTPSVSGGASVLVPLSTFSLTAYAPDQAGADATQVPVPTTGLAVGALAPAVVTGASVAVPVSAVTVTALVPEVGGNLGEAYGLTALLADDLLDLDF